MSVMGCNVPRYSCKKHRGKNVREVPFKNMFVELQKQQSIESWMGRFQIILFLRIEATLVTC